MKHPFERAARYTRHVMGVLWMPVAASALASPPVVEDTGVVAAGECFVESSVVRSSAGRTVSAAPACGLGAGFELTVERAVQSGSEGKGQTGMVLKWSPEALRMSLGGHEVSWGAWLATARAKPAGKQVQAGESSLALITSVQASPELSWHVHVGVVRPDASAPWSRLTHAALYWSPLAAVQWFGELQTFARRDLMGQAVVATGARIWIVPDRWGVFFRSQKASDRPTGWSLGLGWYPPAF